MTTSTRAAGRSFPWFESRVLARRPRRWFAFALALGLLVALVPSGTAHAHADLDRGVAHAENAEFDSALAAFSAAEASGTLDRDELVVLLTERALVLHALKHEEIHEEALKRDLALLAMLDPTLTLGRRAPPALAAAFDRARSQQGGALKLKASCRPSPVGMQISAKPSGLDDSSLATVHVYMRREGEQSFSPLPNLSNDVGASEGDDLLYYAEVVTAGGVVIARAGSETSPLSCQAPDADGAVAGAGGNPRRDGDRRRKLWWWIGAGGAVALTAVAITLVVARDDSSGSQTAVGQPMVTFE